MNTRSKTKTWAAILLLFTVYSGSSASLTLECFQISEDPLAGGATGEVDCIVTSDSPL